MDNAIPDRTSYSGGLRYWHFDVSPHRICRRWPVACVSVTLTRNKSTPETGHASDFIGLLHPDFLRLLRGLGRWLGGAMDRGADSHSMRLPNLHSRWPRSKRHPTNEPIFLNLRANNGD